MAVPTPLLREFVRKVFRDADSGSTTTAAILDSLSDAAFLVKNKGKILTQTTDSMGISATWQVLRGLGGFDLQIELIDRARTAIGDTDNVDDALARIVKVRRKSSSFGRYPTFS